MVRRASPCLLLCALLFGACDPVDIDLGRHLDAGSPFPDGPMGGPACADGIRGAGETDIDCGGPRCGACGDGRRCLAGADCRSGRCEGGTCISCSDGVQNGDESDIDCGGLACVGPVPAMPEARCPLGFHCRAEADCTAGALCLRGLCTQPSRLDFLGAEFYDTLLPFAGMALGDVDGDGLSDVVGSDPARALLVVMRGRGDGSFWPPQYLDLGPGARPGEVAAGDLDGDGRADLVTVDGALVYVWRAATGTAVGRTWSSTATSVALADLDGDHHLDVAVAGPGATVGVLLGDGSGGFGRFLDAPTGLPGADFLAAGDLDGNGCADVVLRGRRGPTPVLLSSCDGSLRAGSVYPEQLDGNGLPVDNAALAAGRFDGDALDDVVAAQWSGSVQLLLAGKAGTLVARHGARVGLPRPLSAAVADFDGDGRGDVALVAGDPPRIEVLLGDGDGQLLAGSEEAAFDAAVRVVAGDLDGDDRPDLVVQASKKGRSGVAVLRNATR